jgi:Zn-dependent protease with chaperone function
VNFALVHPGEKTRFAITATLGILFWLAIIVGTLGLALGYVLLFFLFYLFAQSAFISYLRGSAVKITAEQFPDLHERVKACAAKTGVKEVPDAYLVHADGMFNALATRFLGRNYIVLFSSVVDALSSNPAALNFYIGHELGHIHRRHLVWGPVLAPAVWIPLLGAGLRRAEEYTCDRYGLASCDTAAEAKAGMAALAAGHSRWPALNYAAYQQQRAEVTGFWASFHEIVSDYPWTAKRAFAIDELSQGREPKQLGRNPLAYLFALFVPRVPGAGGAGFIIVVAMVGILAAIAIPAYQDYVKRAALMGVLAQSAGGKAAVEAYASTNNKWPQEIGQLQLGETEFQVGKATVTLELGGDGQLQYRISGGGFNGETLLVTPEPLVEDNELKGFRWHCGSGDIKAQLLPAACRE